MKSLGRSLVALLAVVLSGCIVSSINSFHLATDRVADPELSGVWVQPGDKTGVGDRIQFSRSTNGIYVATMTERGRRSDYDAYLFELGGKRYLEAVPRARAEGSVPFRHLLRVDKIKSRLKFSAFSEDWLKKQLERNPSLLRHTWVKPPEGDTDSPKLVLTGDTAELREFLIKHATDEGAFEGDTEWRKLL